MLFARIEVYIEGEVTDDDLEHLNITIDQMVEVIEAILPELPKGAEWRVNEG